MNIVDGTASQVEATPTAATIGSGDGVIEENIQWLDTFLATALPSFNDEELQSSLLDCTFDVPGIGLSGDESLNEMQLDPSNSITDEEEIAQLLDMRGKVTRLLDTSDEYIAALRFAIPHIRAASEEILRLKDYLARTEELFASDVRRESLPIYREDVSLPMFPAIYRDIPLFAYQTKEVEDVRLLCWGRRWTAKESDRLKKVVLNQCRKIMTMRHAADANVDVLALAAGMSDSQLAHVSLPSNSGDEEEDADADDGHQIGGKDPIDWNFVATSLGTFRTSNECRTHWLMEQRPGLWHNETLDTLQFTRLANGVSYYGRQNNSIVLDWDHVAARMNNGLLAIDCFSAAMQHSMIPAFATTMPSAWAKVPFRPGEAQDVERLCAVWGNRLVIITERLGTLRPKSSVGTRVARILATCDDQLVSWHPRADEGLIGYLCRTLSVRRSKLFAEPHRASDANWGGQFVGKTSGMTAKQVRARWLHILDEYRRQPDKFLKQSKEEVTRKEIGIDISQASLALTATAIQRQAQKRGRKHDDPKQTSSIKRRTRA